MPPRKMIFIVLFVAVSIFIVLESLTEDRTFFYETNFSKIIELHQPLKDNQNIKIIAAYPMTLSNGSSGFPPKYQLLGQMVHNKIMVGGVDVFAPTAQEVYSQVSDISDSGTVEMLTRYGVDTIVIYDMLLDRSAEIIGQLKQDDRLVYVGHYSVRPDDNAYVAKNDLAKSISVFQIKKALSGEFDRQDAYVDGREVKVLGRSGDRIALSIAGLRAGDGIHFTQPFSSGWKLYAGSNADPTGLSYLWANPVFDATHSIDGDYGNLWIFDAHELETSVAKSEYTENPDGSIDLELTIFFRPRSYLYLDWIIAAITFSLCLAYLGHDLIMRRRNNSGSLVRVTRG